MKASLQAPMGPPRPVGRSESSSTRTSASSTDPPASRAIDSASAMLDLWESSPDSKPTINSAIPEPAPALLLASSGSSRRRLAGHSFDWTSLRVASQAASQLSKVTAALARKRGRSWIRIHASEMTSITPSEPITSLLGSGPAPDLGSGPAPDAGSLRVSHQPRGVSVRTDSTKSSMGVWLVA
jgi:hypothetical protein